MSKIAVFPGSFDPFTKGHEALVRQALEVFDRVIVAVGVNTSKQGYFATDKRLAHIASLFVNEERVSIQSFTGLTVEFCKANKAQFIVRGLRDSKDFEFEKSIAHMNETLSGIHTVFLLTAIEFGAINSTIVREIHKSGGQIDAFVTNAGLLV